MPTRLAYERWCSEALCSVHQDDAVAHAPAHTHAHVPHIPDTHRAVLSCREHPLPFSLQHECVVERRSAENEPTRIIDRSAHLEANRRDILLVSVKRDDLRSHA
jgi:hypothetical protein